MTGAEFALIALLFCCGAFIQGTVGFGMNLIAAPVIAFVAPEILPAVPLLASLPLTVMMTLRERGAVDRRGATWSIAGRIPGTIAGVVVVTIVSTDVLTALIGGIVVVAVGISLVHTVPTITPTTAAAAGVASGFMGTAAAIGGPPMALLYSGRPAAELRSTVSVTFAVGSAIAIVGLAVGGAIEWGDLGLAAALAPIIQLGLWASRFAIGRIDPAGSRTAVLTLATLAGVAAITRSIV